MVPANAQNKAILRELVDLDIEAKNKANFEKAFLEAFDLLKRAVSVCISVCSILSCFKTNP